MTDGRIVDSDSHLLEPANLWEENLEPQYRSRALSLRRDEKNLEYLYVDGKKSNVYRDGEVTALAFVGKSRKWVNEHAHLTYTDAAKEVPGAINPHERIKLMDGEGVYATFIYPSLSLGWPFDCEDPHLSAAFCRVYNDWIVNFCKAYPDRIYTIAQLPMWNIDDCVEELRRAVNTGARGGYIPPAPINRIGYGNSYYHPLWATAQELEVPITLHVSSNPNYPGRHLYPAGDQGQGFFQGCLDHADFLISFTHMMCEGVFERFPGLRVNMVEDGSGWMIHWLDRMDVKYEEFGDEMPLAMKPSEYFKRQVWISIEPNERSVPTLAQVAGADRLIWGSDWPHSEGHLDAVGKMKKNVAPLPEEDQKKILGENALALYGIS